MFRVHSEDEMVLIETALRGRLTGRGFESAYLDIAQSSGPTTVLRGLGFVSPLILLSLRAKSAASTERTHGTDLSPTGCMSLRPARRGPEGQAMVGNVGTVEGGGSASMVVRWRMDSRMATGVYIGSEGWRDRPAGRVSCLPRKPSSERNVRADG